MTLHNIKTLFRRCAQIVEKVNKFII